MVHTEELGLLVGAVALGAIHGIEPGHGWPVAASYALDRTNKWVYGFAASLVIGVGHLVSSIAMVGAFFYAKAYFDLTRIDEPIELIGDIHVGGPVSLVAGVLLVALGVREYFHGHSHGGTGHADEDHGRDGEHGRGHGHEPRRVHDHRDHGDDHGHDHGGAHSHTRGEAHSHTRGAHSRAHDEAHSHSHGDPDATADRGLLGIAWFAFVLGFAHEEEFEIIALCAGSNYCLELMSAYALTVIGGIVGLTMLLIAGYQHFEEEVEKYTPYLPAFSAAVLISMGVGFIVGLF